MLTLEQREARQGYIGGSEVASLLPGVPSYKTPLEVWLSKRDPNSAPALNDGVDTPLYWGSVLEAPIADAFAKEAGVKLMKRTRAYRDKTHPWRGALIDRWVVGERCGVEVKNRGLWRRQEYGTSGSDGCLDTDLVQAHWCMALTKTRVWYVAVLIGGNDFRWYRVPREQALIENMFELVDAFWNDYVLKDIAPPPETAGDCLLRWPTGLVESKAADAQALDWVANLASLKAEGKARKAEEEALKVKLMSFLGDSKSLVHPTDGKKLAIWPRFDRTNFNAKKLKADNPELHAEYSTTSRVQQFRLL